MYPIDNIAFYIIHHYMDMKKAHTHFVESMYFIFQLGIYVVPFVDSAKVTNGSKQVSAMKRSVMIQRS